MLSPAARPAPVQAMQLLIWGAGAHGQVVADLVRAAGHTLVGYVDRDAAKVGATVERGGGKVLLTEKALLSLLESGGALGADAVVLAVGDNRERDYALSTLAARCAPAMVHPSAIVSPSASLAIGSVVLPGVIVNAEARIGPGAILNTGCIVEHDCVLGAGVHLSPRATLCGNVHVGALSWIGAGATIVPGVRVGRDVRVGAGAVVIRDVPDGCTVVGVPARRTAERPVA